MQILSVLRMTTPYIPRVVNKIQLVTVKEFLDVYSIS